MAKWNDNKFAYGQFTVLIWTAVEYVSLSVVSLPDLYWMLAGMRWGVGLGSTENAWHFPGWAQGIAR